MIMDDASTPSDDREIASIVRDLNHTPTADDKVKLKEILDE